MIFFLRGQLLFYYCLLFLVPVEVEKDLWTINEEPMPIISNSSHIGIQKFDRNTAGLTIEENIKNQEEHYIV